MAEQWYTLVHGPMAGVVVSNLGNVLDPERRGERAAAACYAWNGPPQPDLAGGVTHLNGDPEDCSFDNVVWEGRHFPYDTLVRHVNGVLHDNRVDNLFMNRDVTRPAACWAVALERTERTARPSCIRCGKVTRYGYTCTVSHRLVCRNCITRAADSAAAPTQRLYGRLQIRDSIWTAVTGVHGNEVRVARGSKNAISRMMLGLGLERAVVRVVTLDPTDPCDTRAVTAKATLKAGGSLQLRGDVADMQAALSADDSYVTVSTKDSPHGCALVRRDGGDFHELSHGFLLIDAFARLVERSAQTL